MGNSERKHRQHTPEEKVAILRRHLIDVRIAQRRPGAAVAGATDRDGVGGGGDH